ncbi:MAG TPA: hypothetical protein VG297_12520 [Bryobacteraceae bacterium]|jgi:hypothetical protein|nr:hypothetical protein [Bryobacteraceae bacterium]
MRFYMALFLAAPLAAQHDMANMPGMQHDATPSATTTIMEASGTSANPASSPMTMTGFTAGHWTLMFHGVAFITGIQQTGPRGADKFISTSWFMGEASHKLAGGTFSLRSMLSLDPATVTDRRYPELFQTGETAYGKPIVDAQHPHDFVMELALHYSHPLSDKSSWEIYAAPVGDPALGPVAFPHRVSAEELPQATLGHHLQDSTHISSEVVTGAVTRGIFRLEASGFHGAEPGENRWNIDHGAIDSYSARLTLSPNPNWTGQFSAGRLAHPEQLERGDQIRTTASVTWNRPYTNGHWATSLIWGRVHKTAGGANLNGYGLESVAQFAHRNYVTGRIELVDKDELLATGQQFRVSAYTAGYTRDFYPVPHIAAGIGANITGYAMPAALHANYGDHPVSVLFFIRFKLRPAA